MTLSLITRDYKQLGLMLTIVVVIAVIAFFCLWVIISETFGYSCSKVIYETADKDRNVIITSTTQTCVKKETHIHESKDQESSAAN